MTQPSTNGRNEMTNNIHETIQSLREKAENEYARTIASKIVTGKMTDDELTLYALDFLAENLNEEDF